MQPIQRPLFAKHIQLSTDFLKAKEMWFDNPLMYVDADAIEPMVNDFYKTISRCVRTFYDMPKIQAVAVAIRVSFVL